MRRLLPVAATLAFGCSAPWVPSWLRDPTGPTVCVPPDARWVCDHGQLTLLEHAFGGRSQADAGEDE